jgi:hypothetical protein
MGYQPTSSPSLGEWIRRIFLPSHEGMTRTSLWAIGRSDLIDYMHRWRLRTPWFQIRIHHILRSDNDRALHDHPFTFLSFILKGEYHEVTPSGTQLWKRFSIIFRRAEDQHRLILDSGPVWTLVIGGPYRREWGFYTPSGWKRWDQYDQKVTD